MKLLLAAGALTAGLLTAVPVAAQTAAGYQLPRITVDFGAGPVTMSESRPETPALPRAVIASKHANLPDGPAIDCAMTRMADRTPKMRTEAPPKTVGDQAFVKPLAPCTGH
jgi:hypothetical protein